MSACVVRAETAQADTGRYCLQMRKDAFSQSTAHINILTNKKLIEFKFQL